MTLVDSNVLLDVLTNDPVWLRWSVDMLEARAAQGSLFIDEVVYAEISVRSDNKAELDRRLTILGVEFQHAPADALYLAGKIFGRYRSAGGVRTGVLPDFFIGAHAQVARLPLLTRDVRRYRTYFTDVKLIAPEA